MKLSSVDHAELPESKVKGYLLNASHRAGAAKAKFFMALGFDPDHWRQLAQALVEHARTYDIAATDPNRYGVRYVIDGPLQSPRGTTRTVRVVWFVETGESIPRLVTAYPLGEGLPGR